MTVTTVAVAHGPGELRVEQVPLHPPPPLGGTLAVEACGVCGTDLEILGRAGLGRDLGPVVLGHEMVGTVAALGEGAAARWGVAVGDRIAVEEFIPCHDCERCRAGAHQLCARTDLRAAQPFLRYGATPLARPPGLWGGFAEHLHLHPDAIIHPLPTGLDAELATLFVPVGNGLHWVGDVARGWQGEALAVFGPGLHGLGCVVAGHAVGMSPIVVFGLASDMARAQAALSLGADRFVAVDDPAGRADLRRRFDVVVDVTPADVSVLPWILDVVRVRGRIVFASGSGADGLAPAALMRHELRAFGVRGRDRASAASALDLLAADPDRYAPLCTHRIGLADLPAQLPALPRPEVVHATVVPPHSTG
ncbi:MAG TPA: medium chain dehydrogenase/reductase family protein [Euzebya sp.]|nr:medium chain dehydrogenase/reductase family protein [Euzebya sp.]